jgi:hypothetical protein
MARKTLIPEAKWEGLRQAMEEAAGARKAAGKPGDPRVGIPAGDSSGRNDGPKRKAEDGKGKGKDGKKEGKAGKKGKETGEGKSGKKGKKKEKKKGKKKGKKRKKG